MLEESSNRRLLSFAVPEKDALTLLVQQKLGGWQVTASNPFQIGITLVDLLLQKDSFLAGSSSSNIMNVASSFAILMNVFMA